MDDKGRLKLPSAFQQYLVKLGEQKVFVTSLDSRTVRIYPIGIWRVNEKFFQDSKDKAAADVSFLANDLGADSEIDSQGRILIPTELRRMLGIESAPVWLEHYKGRFNLYSKDLYEDRRRRALEGLEEKLERLERDGLL